jgi:hypothetical protein
MSLAASGVVYDDAFQAPTMKALTRGPHFFEIFILIQVVILHLVFHLTSRGLRPASILVSLVAVCPRLFVLLGLGVLGRLLYEIWRGRGRVFLRRIANREWLLLSVRIILGAGLVAHFYSLLKLTIPLLNPMLFDSQLWEVDRWMLFGLSPNVFFLELFSEPLLLRAIDWSYGALYFPVLALSFPFFFSFSSKRMRLAFAAGYATTWGIGAWFYLLVPALGPCYDLPELWSDTAIHMPVSRKAQLMLIDNYRQVLELKKQILLPGLNTALGVAAFPSLHLASQFFIARWARRVSRPLGFALYLSVGILFIGSIVTGWHYMVDSVAGILLAWGCDHFAMRLYGLQGWARGSRPLGGVPTHPPGA